MTDIESKWRGVFVIVTTPFDQNLRVDVDGLKRTMRFCLDAGVQGVVSTANASEVSYLSDAERRMVAEIVVGEAKGQATTIVGVSSTCWPIAEGHAQHAEKIGADAIMAMPPTFQKASENEIRAYYRAISDSSSLPIFLQNYGGPGGTAMSPRFMKELLKDIPNIRFVKEETEFSSVLMSEVLSGAGEELLGVMGGKAGIRLLDEYRRGACGTMPACEVSDVHVSLWKALEAGDIQRAKEIYRLMLPLLVFEVGYGPAVYKEVLKRRNVIGSSAFRQTGGRVLDTLAIEELKDILKDMNHLMHADYRLQDVAA
ncbi:dihydrodipicolinate synthase family protein [Ochrobactrum sp. C6C9]|uniref:dihydrodipicolinate synthase family protein n=1 Tax=Ochrobactrum sp. C6C9 TaxID=2736662 RepID=UPI00352FF968|nr:dihydrodipicolinate synthase family protein [Ochrobactrum sp. C6C9]